MDPRRLGAPVGAHGTQHLVGAGEAPVAHGALRVLRQEREIAAAVGHALDDEMGDALGPLHPRLDGDDERWRPTTIIVNLEDDHGTGTGDVIRLMRRAGWEPTSVCFSRNRLTFEAIDDA